MDNGQRVVGRIDLIIRTADGLVVMDHKLAGNSDGKVEEIVAAWAPQLALYATAIARVSGKPPVGTWLNLPLEGSAVRVIGRRCKPLGVPRPRALRAPLQARPVTALGRVGLLRAPLRFGPSDRPSGALRIPHAHGAVRVSARRAPSAAALRRVRKHREPARLYAGSTSLMISLRPSTISANCSADAWPILLPMRSRKECESGLS